MLKTWLSERKLAGATAESLVFSDVPNKPQNGRRTSTWMGWRKERIEAIWEENARAIAGPDMVREYEARVRVAVPEGGRDVG